ncbi:MAG: hypothetical protein GY856_04110, partial [bacterium]|nr:hypothetical protein [bacterium]
MSAQDCRERVREPQERALNRYARTRAESTARRDQPPQPGEILAFPETAGRGVLWAVIDQDPADPQRFLLVAADVEPLAGSADVAVAASGERGPWSLRCRFAIRLRAAELVGAKRAAYLESEVVERVRRKRTRIAAGEAVGSALEQETDAEPEYQDWLGELEKARTALSGKQRPEAGEPGEVALFPSRSRWRPSGNFYALAASILLVVSLGLSGWIRWQSNEISRLKRELDAEVNVPVVVFSQGDVRGEAKSVILSPAVSSFVLMFQPSEDYPRYRLEIRDKDTDTVVWSTDELSSVEIEMFELSVKLPRRHWPAGEYRLHLAGLRDGRAEPLGEYALRIKN